uniref:Uncharacterized protein n=1 Tax=Anguilla anguilla TaxID=7936 RepID=A0A0E9XUB9_ANGAN
MGECRECRNSSTSNYKTIVCIYAPCPVSF